MEWRDSRRLTMKIRKEIHEKEIQTMKLIKTKKRKKKKYTEQSNYSNDKNIFGGKFKR